MPILCKPAVSVPEHVVTLETTLAVCKELHAKHPKLELALRLIRNTGVKTRYIIRPLEETLVHDGLERRNALYELHAKARCPAVVEEALRNAELEVRDIDAIVFVSCTGFLMPSLCSWLINQMGFSLSTTQIPVAQMGCAAGGHSINRALEFCLANPGSNVLLVACEFCSLCYQPDDQEVGNLLSNGLFGDAIAAAVVRSDGGSGLTLSRSASYIIPNTEDWISYVVKPTGFHFRLDKRVPATMQPIAPALREVVRRQGWDAGSLGLYIIHAGGPRILTDLARYLEVPEDSFKYSRDTLRSFGNIASAVVFDALRRAFEDGAVIDGVRSMIAGFGPGITAEITLGTGPAQHVSRPQHHC